MHLDNLDSSRAMDVIEQQSPIIERELLTTEHELENIKSRLAMSETVSAVTKTVLESIRKEYNFVDKYEETSADYESKIVQKLEDYVEEEEDLIKPGDDDDELVEKTIEAFKEENQITLNTDLDVEDRDIIKNSSSEQEDDKKSDIVGEESSTTEHEPFISSDVDLNELITNVNDEMKEKIDELEQKFKSKLLEIETKNQDEIEITTECEENDHEEKINLILKENQIDKIVMTVHDDESGEELGSDEDGSKLFSNQNEQDVLNSSDDYIETSKLITEEITKEENIVSTNLLNVVDSKPISLSRARLIENSESENEQFIISKEEVEEEIPTSKLENIEEIVEKPLNKSKQYQTFESSSSTNSDLNRQDDFDTLKRKKSSSSRKENRDDKDEDDFYDDNLDGQRVKLLDDDDNKEIIVQEQQEKEQQPEIIYSSGNVSSESFSDIKNQVKLKEIDGVPVEKLSYLNVVDSSNIHASESREFLLEEHDTHVDVQQTSKLMTPSNESVDDVSITTIIERRLSDQQQHDKSKLVEASHFSNSSEEDEKNFNKNDDKIETVIGIEAASLINSSESEPELIEHAVQDEIELVNIDQANVLIRDSSSSEPLNKLLQQQKEDIDVLKSNMFLELNKKYENTNIITEPVAILAQDKYRDENNESPLAYQNSSSSNFSTTTTSEECLVTNTSSTNRRNILLDNINIPNSVENVNFDQISAGGSSMNESVILSKSLNYLNDLVVESKLEHDVEINDFTKLTDSNNSLITGSNEIDIIDFKEVKESHSLNFSNKQAVRPATLNNDYINRKSYIDPFYDQTNLEQLEQQTPTPISSENVVGDFFHKRVTSSNEPSMDQIKGIDLDNQINEGITKKSSFDIIVEKENQQNEEVAAAVATALLFSSTIKSQSSSDEVKSMSNLESDDNYESIKIKKNINDASPREYTKYITLSGKQDEEIEELEENLDNTDIENYQDELNQDEIDQEEIETNTSSIKIIQTQLPSKSIKLKQNESIISSEYIEKVDSVELVEQKSEDLFVMEDNKEEEKEDPEVICTKDGIVLDDSSFLVCTPSSEEPPQLDSNKNEKENTLLLAETIVKNVLSKSTEILNQQVVEDKDKVEVEEEVESTIVVNENEDVDDNEFENIYVRNKSIVEDDNLENNVNDSPNLENKADINESNESLKEINENLTKDVKIEKTTEKLTQSEPIDVTNNNSETFIENETREIDSKDLEEDVIQQKKDQILDEVMKKVQEKFELIESQKFEESELKTEILEETNIQQLEKEIDEQIIEHENEKIDTKAEEFEELVSEKVEQEIVEIRKPEIEIYLESNSLIENAEKLEESIQKEQEDERIENCSIITSESSSLMENIQNLEESFNRIEQERVDETNENQNNEMLEDIAKDFVGNMLEKAIDKVTKEDQKENEKPDKESKIKYSPRPSSSDSSDSDDDKDENKKKKAATRESCKSPIDKQFHKKDDDEDDKNREKEQDDKNIVSNILESSNQECSNVQDQQQESKTDDSYSQKESTIKKSDSFNDNLNECENKLIQTQEFCNYFENEISKNTENLSSLLVSSTSELKLEGLNDLKNETLTLNKIESTLESANKLEECLSQHFDNMCDAIAIEQQKINDNFQAEMNLINDNKKDDLMNITPQPLLTSSFISVDDTLPNGENLDDTISEHATILQDILDVTAKDEDDDNILVEIEARKSPLSSECSFFTAVSSIQNKQSQNSVNTSVNKNEDLIENKRLSIHTSTSSNYMTAVDDLAINSNRSELNLSTSDSFHTAFAPSTKSSSTNNKNVLKPSDSRDENLASIASSYSKANSSFVSLNSSCSTINDLDKTDFDITDNSSQFSNTSYSTLNQTDQDNELIGKFNVEIFLKNMHPLVNPSESTEPLVQYDKNKNESNQSTKMVNESLVETGSSHSTITDEDYVNRKTSSKLNTEEFTMINKEDLVIDNTKKDAVIDESEYVFADNASKNEETEVVNNNITNKPPPLNKSIENITNNNSNNNDSASSSPLLYTAKNGNNGSGDNVSYTSSILEFEKLEMVCDMSDSPNGKSKEDLDDLAQSENPMIYDENDDEEMEPKPFDILSHDLNTIYESVEKEDIEEINVKKDEEVKLNDLEMKESTNSNQNETIINTVLIELNASPQINEIFMKKNIESNEFIQSDILEISKEKRLSTPSILLNPITNSLNHSRSTSSSSVKSSDSFENEIQYNYKIDESSFFARKLREKEPSPPIFEVDEPNNEDINTNSKTNKLKLMKKLDISTSKQSDSGNESLISVSQLQSPANSENLVINQGQRKMTRNDSFASSSAVSSSYMSDMASSEAAKLNLPFSNSLFLNDLKDNKALAHSSPTEPTNEFSAPSQTPTLPPLPTSRSISKIPKYQQPPSTWSSKRSSRTCSSTSSCSSVSLNDSSHRLSASGLAHALKPTPQPTYNAEDLPSFRKQASPSPLPPPSAPSTTIQTSSSLTSNIDKQTMIPTSISHSAISSSSSSATIPTTKVHSTNKSSPNVHTHHSANCYCGKNVHHHQLEYKNNNNYNIITHTPKVSHNSNTTTTVVNTKSNNNITKNNQKIGILNKNIINVKK